MKRTLTVNEINELKVLYFNEIDYGKIVITNEHIFSYLLKKFSAIVFDNTIVFTKKSYREDFSKSVSSMSLLVHEMCHVWQFQRLNYRWYKAGIEHIKYGTSAYVYHISDHKKLTDFRFEQQGDIMADYYKLRQNNSTQLSLYEEVIYCVIQKKTEN